MNKTSIKLTLLAGSIATACLFVAPAVHAEDTAAPTAQTKADKRAERKAKHDAEMLKKYDKNGNGVLDPDEIAAMKADQEKAKAQHKKKHKKEGAAD